MIWWLAMTSASAGPPAVTEEMHERYALVTEARDALIRGDLAHARASAGRLVEMESVKVPRKWRAWLGGLEQSARRLESAEDITAASAALGDIVAVCGECHAAAKGGPELGRLGEIPAQAWSEGQNMSLHRWAMHWMWLGVIKGDDEVWKRGATELDNRPMTFRFGDEAPEGIKLLERRVYMVASDALSSDPKDRGTLMGELVSTCSACHTQLSAGPASPSEAPIEPEDTTPELETGSSTEPADPG